MHSSLNKTHHDQQGTVADFKRKNAQREGRELSFIWSKVRTVAQEIAPQIALRNRSEEVEEKDSIHVILVKVEYIQ